MKNNTLSFKALYIFLMLFAWEMRGHTQPTLTPAETEQLIEKTTLMTDREIYCVEENIFFSAINVSSPALRNANWSNVLYLELISPDGQTFAQRKYAYDQQGAEGILKIPKSILTGNYYLRAYTRWMRDYSPGNYFYKMITVINPFRPELLEGTAMKIQGNHPGKTLQDTLSGWIIHTDKKIFSKREKVTVEISALNSEDFNNTFSVAVIPKGTEMPLNPVIPGFQKVSFSPDFIPETRGLSISGQVVNATDSLPIPFTLVGLTVFKENPESHHVMTNEKGQFFFDLAKLKGAYEIFISAKSAGKQKPLILVDNDFSTQKISLPFVPMDLSENSIKLYQTLSFNSQIQQLYHQPKTEAEAESFSSDSAFYGHPDFVLHMKEFIAMPTLKDYIIELIPQVMVRHEEKTTVLKVFGTHPDLSVYPPMVLMDMVSVFDIDRILAVSPDKIERIEVVSEPYVRGDITYGGIISFFSKKGDLAGIDLPSAGRFITYSMLNSQMAQVSPIPASLRIPAVQNCLYWNPGLKLKGQAPQKISFETGDCPGQYLIVIRALDKDQKIKVSTLEIGVN